MNKVQVVYCLDLQSLFPVLLCMFKNVGPVDKNALVGHNYCVRGRFDVLKNEYVKEINAASVCTE